MATGKPTLLLILAVLVLCSVHSTAAAPILVTKCGVLSAPGHYSLITDITGSTAATCIEITASGVTFDGNGHTIGGTGSAGSKGVWIHGSSSSPLTGVGVTDVAVSRWATGVYALYARDSAVTDVLAENNDYGISFSETDTSLIGENLVRNNNIEEVYLWYSAGNTVRNNRILSPNTFSLALLMTGSDKNLVYNNYINNTRGIVAPLANDWNTGETSGSNIIGGPSLGGNFWATPAGNGYSETCDDTDADGFCDAPYSLSAGNTDQLPLSEPFAIKSCRRIIAPGTYHLLRDILDSTETTCIEIMGSDIFFEGGGHTIGGNGTLVTYGIGVFNLHPYEPRRVTVTNVTLRNWTVGLHWYNGIGGTLTRATLRDNTRNGLYVLESANISISHTVATGNGLAGAGLISVRNSSLTRSHLFANNRGSDLDYGLVLTDTTATLVADNNVSMNGHIGLYLFSSRDNTLRNNTVDANGNFGIIVTKTVPPYPVSSGNTISGNTFRGNGQTGMAIRSGSVNNTFTGNKVLCNPGYGIEISGSSTLNELTKNTVTGNGGSGVYVSESGGNLFADNYFNNTMNFASFSPLSNTWNTTKQAGVNVIGGQFRGGNFWAHPDGTGHSETCGDANGDGICDTPFSFGPLNADYLPLKERGTVSGCTVITQPGTYEVVNDIVNSNAVSCIRISSSDVILDGNGHTVDGISAGGSRGVDVSRDFRTLTNVTVRNLVLTNWGQGIFAARAAGSHFDGNTVVKNHQGIETDMTSNSSFVKNAVSDNTGHGILLHSACRNNSIMDNTVTDNGFSGIYLHELSSGNEVIGNKADRNGENGIFIQGASDRNTIRRNLVRSNTGSGILVFGSSDNTIADNAFNNSVNVKFRDMTANTWNSSRHDAKNIIGGPVSGGNSFAQPDRLGFSETCPDANHDGICDDAYSLDAGNTDRLPLVAFTLLPLPGCTNLPTDPDGDGIYEDLNGNRRLDFADVVLFFSQMQWVAANEPIFLFDPNRNGRIDFADIVALFSEV